MTKPNRAYQYQRIILKWHKHEYQNSQRTRKRKVKKHFNNIIILLPHSSRLQTYHEKAVFQDFHDGGDAYCGQVQRIDSLELHTHSKSLTGWHLRLSVHINTENVCNNNPIIIVWTLYYADQRTHVYNSYADKTKGLTVLLFSWT